MDIKKKINRKISVAPMMDCTDRHDRYFLRLISKNVMLYTEMVVSKAVLRGDKQKLLKFNDLEKPLALQVGGSDKKELAEVAKIAEVITMTATGGKKKPAINRNIFIKINITHLFELSSTML